MNDINENVTDNYYEDKNEFKKEFFKYLYFWKLFLASIGICFLTAYIFNRYTEKTYISSAKIKIIDKKATSLELPTAASMFSNSKINLENEMEVITSKPILEEVVRNLNLTQSVKAVGDISKKLITNPPFDVVIKTPIDSIKKSIYILSLKDDVLTLINQNKKDQKILFKNFSTYGLKHDFPIEIFNIKLDNWIEDEYHIYLTPINEVIKNIKKNITVNSLGKKSEILEISYSSRNPLYSQKIVNEIISVFNLDGIRDRQLIHKRTIEFVNERYLYLSLELDSIETDKQTFKSSNKLIDLKASSVISLQKINKSEENIFTIEKEIFITSSLLESLDNLDFELLPSNIGIMSNEINSLIAFYNQNIIERKKLVLGAGFNNPAVKQLENIINDNQLNIYSSLENHIERLEKLKKALSKESIRIGTQFANFPLKEKTLRSINRNQQVKEALYLFLLQKREEAEVSYAITEASIKVVEYANLHNIPISPNPRAVFLIAFLCSILIPFGGVYLFFFFDTKINSKVDVEEKGLDVLGEIPFFNLNNSKKIFSNPSDRSLVSESFRILMSNIRYLFKTDKESKVILVTSSIKGEGKTLCALNLSLAFASLNKKVLLVGGDFRNPQIHKNINESKNQPGIVNFLTDNKIDWRTLCLNKFPKNTNHSILLCGPVPPNPINLLTSDNFDLFLNQARKDFDIIIIDSAPTLLVADTKNIIQKSDAILYLIRAGLTDKNILNYIKSFNIGNENSLGIVLNGVGIEGPYGYDKKSYNYGYNYGYNEEP